MSTSLVQRALVEYQRSSDICKFLLSSFEMNKNVLSFVLYCHPCLNPPLVFKVKSVFLKSFSAHGGTKSGVSGWVNPALTDISLLLSILRVCYLADSHYSLQVEQQEMLQHAFNWNNHGAGWRLVLLKVFQMKIHHLLSLLSDKGKVDWWRGGLHAHTERSWELNKSENSIRGR